MRKLLSILALSCLLFLTAGYHLLYHVRIAEAKAEMKKSLLVVKSNSVSKLIFSPGEFSSLEWEDENEFRYMGTMYDMVKVEKTGSQTVIWCLSDEKETVLVNNYLKTQKQSSGNSSAVLLKMLTVQYMPASTQQLFPPIIKIKQTATVFHCLLPETDDFILTPPPQAC